MEESPREEVDMIYAELAARLLVALTHVIHALEESVVVSFVPQLLAACLLLRAAAC
jgi:hypothetical protein